MCGLCWFIPNYDDEPLELVDVYRLYDDAQRLLYVGISSRTNRRWHEHNQSSDWWFMVSSATIIHYETRKEALDAEWQAIRDEDPMFNTRRRAPKHWLRWSQHPSFRCRDNDCKRKSHSQSCIMLNIMHLKWWVGERHTDENPLPGELIFR